MAMAKITLKCEKCGEEFEMRKDCRNRAEADSYEAWAQANVTECPACRRKAKEAEQADELTALLARYGRKLPEITGVSEKQIRFAEDMRRKHLTAELHNLTNELEITANYNAMMADPDARAEFEANCAAEGKTPEEMLQMVLDEASTEAIHIMLTSTNAREVIDAAK